MLVGDRNVGRGHVSTNTFSYAPAVVEVRLGADADAVIAGRRRAAECAARAVIAFVACDGVGTARLEGMGCRSEEVRARRVVPNFAGRQSPIDDF